MSNMGQEERTERIGVRVSPTESAMLEKLAEADGLAASDVVRMLVRKAYAERFGDKKPKATK